MTCTCDGSILGPCAHCRSLPVQPFILTGLDETAKGTANRTFERYIETNLKLEAVTAERDELRLALAGAGDLARGAIAQVAVLRAALRAIQAAVGTSTEAWHLAEKVLLNPSPAAERLLEQATLDRAVTVRDPALVEALADVEHRRWAGWMLYQLSKGSYLPSPVAGWHMPQWAVDRWERQARTSYSDLTEDEKDSDRNEVLKTLNALDAWRKAATPATEPI